MTNPRRPDSLPGGPGGSSQRSPLDGLSEHDRQLIDAVVAVGGVCPDCGRWMPNLLEARVLPDGRLQAHCDPHLVVTPCRQAAAERAARLEKARRERPATPAEEREIERLLGGRTP